MGKRSYKLVKRTATAIEALQDAASVLEDLAGEMGDWRDNIQDAFEGTEKYERVEQAAELLEEAHSEVEFSIEELEALAERLADGEGFIPACRCHQPCVPCPYCGWDGQLLSTQRGQRRRYTDGKVSFVAGTVRRIRTPDGRVVKRGQVALPPMLRERPGKDALAGFAMPMVAWVDTMPYGRRSPSRATRLGNARAEAEVALDALAVATDVDTSKLDEELADTVTDLRDKLEEVRNAFDALDDVEFPGMYG